MVKNWFQHKEVMAGAKRLVLSYYLYKLFGKLPLMIISFFVSLGAFITSKERRLYSKQFFKALEKYTNQKYPASISSFKQFLNYGNSLVDKIISFSGGFPCENFVFKDEDSKEFMKLISEEKGVFFLTTHIGNAEILQSLLQSDKFKKPKGVNIFLEARTCEVFRSFLNSIKTEKENVSVYAVENTDIQTAIEISEKLENGEIVFMAGDRIAYNNPDKTYKSKLLNKTINLPQGALRFSQALKFPIFFIVCAKEKNLYNIHAKRFTQNSTDRKQFLEDLKKEYGEFIEKYAVKYPYQFFHFYKLFED